MFFNITGVIVVIISREKNKTKILINELSWRTQGHTSRVVFSSPPAEVETGEGAKRRGGNCIKIEGKVTNPDTPGTSERLASFSFSWR